MRIKIKEDNELHKKMSHRKGKGKEIKQLEVK